MTAVPLRVLFVDDEARVLAAIERMLFDVEGWELAFASSGEEALARLAADRFAVVVTDMRMPGMDGAALLERVMATYPETVRVVLSGQTEEAAAVRAIRVAHRVLAKPCSATALRDVIERTQRLVSSLGDERLRSSVAGLGPLPSPPQTYLELMSALGQEEASIADVSRIVARDPALTAKVLQVANAAVFHRGSGEVSNIRDAVVRVGIRLLAILALVEGVFKNAAGAAIDVESLRARSRRMADHAARLAKPEQRDDAFAAGLLADVGLLAIAASGSAKLRLALESVAHGDVDAERHAFGASHAEVGAYLLGLWGLPYRVVEAVATHHTPDAIPRHDAPIAALAYVANALASGVESHPEILEAYALRIPTP